MLVLSRTKGEALIIDTPQGDTITVKVLRVGNSAVKLGVDAPQHITINREEVATKKVTRPVLPDRM